MIYSTGDDLFKGNFPHVFFVMSLYRNRVIFCSALFVVFYNHFQIFLAVSPLFQFSFCFQTIFISLLCEKQNVGCNACIKTNCNRFVVYTIKNENSANNYDGSNGPSKRKINENKSENTNFIIKATSNNICDEHKQKTRNRTKKQHEE